MGTVVYAKLNFALRTMFDWTDLFSPHALLAAGGWGIASAMAIHHLHITEPSRLRSVLYAVVCSVVFVAALFVSAREHRDARVSQEQARLIKDGIDKIQTQLRTTNQTPDQILSAAAAKIIQQGKDLVEANKRLSAAGAPSQQPSLSRS
jgi:hypothetical protein